MNIKRPTIPDIATLAGVSIATVDRVLSDRAKVSHRSTIKVLGALRALGLADRPVPGARGSFRFQVVLTLEDRSFFERYQRAFLAQAAIHGVQLEMHRVTDPDHEIPALISSLEERGGRCHGLIVVGKNSVPMQARIAALAAVGIPTILLVSPMESLPTADYIGIDNEMAGRTAAFLLGNFMGGCGTALLITNALAMQNHIQRVRGFTNVCAARFPGLHIIGPVECHDLDDACGRAVEACRHAGTTLDGIYNTGAGNAGIAHVLGATPMGAWVGHELTPVNTDLLARGAMSAVLDQDVALQVETCILELLHRHGVIDRPVNLTVPFHVVTPENIEPVA